MPSDWAFVSRTQWLNLLADIYSSEFLPLDRQESLLVARQKMFFSIKHVHSRSLFGSLYWSDYAGSVVFRFLKLCGINDLNSN